jgi:protein-S-isoprenylcysteine O-methyltransferase Ste14
MDWNPSLSPGIWNGWLFMIIFPLQWLLVVILPKRIAERTSHAPDVNRGRRDIVMAWLTQGLWIGATILSVFILFRTGTAWVWTGLAVFGVGLVVLVLATVSVSQTPPGEPFSTSVYRYSRHPMYLSMLLVYLAVSIAAASWLFFLITVATYFLQSYQARKEEAGCCELFGRSYRDYLAATPKWLGIPKN